jgi:hypothetical protein
VLTVLTVLTAQQVLTVLTVPLQQFLLEQFLPGQLVRMPLLQIAGLQLLLY